MKDLSRYLWVRLWPKGGKWRVFKIQKFCQTCSQSGGNTCPWWQWHENQWVQALTVITLRARGYRPTLCLAKGLSIGTPNRWYWQKTKHPTPIVEHGGKEVYMTGVPPCTLGANVASQYSACSTLWFCEIGFSLYYSTHPSSDDQSFTPSVAFSTLNLINWEGTQLTTPLQANIDKAAGKASDANPPTCDKTRNLKSL